MTDQGPNTGEQTEPTAGTSDEARSSNINRPWLWRIVIITVCLLGYAAWSLYDAFVAYPERGQSYASWAEWRYLDTAIEADRSESPGILRRETAITDPVAELARLRSEEIRSRNESDLQGGPRQKRAEMEIAREDWLRSLAVIGHLHPAYTNFYANPDRQAAEELASLDPSASNTEAITALRARLEPASPRDRFERLSARWNTESPPGQLRSYDIPVNKIQAVICIGFAGYLLFLFARVASRTYRWDPDGKVLTLPSGESIAPADLEDVDKRKWDKFIVFLKIKDSHSQLGGQEIKFDTYRHGRVEDWLLAMEKAAFPDRVEESTEAEATPETGETAAAG
jgi:hypothetical protein